MKRSAIEKFDLMTDAEFAEQGRKADELLADARDCQRRDSFADSGAVVFKRHDPTQAVTTKAATNDDAWNEWADAKIQAATDMLADVIGAETGRNEKKLRKEIKALREQVNALAAELEILRIGKVVDIKGGRDVA